MISLQTYEALAQQLLDVKSVQSERGEKRGERREERGERREE
jgi:hypothetical protein